MRTLRTALPCLLAASLAACGGDFSNDDLEFLNALPEREDLAAKLPESARSSGAVGPRAQAGVSEPSQLFADTRKASDEFNQGLDGLLTLVERIRESRPTKRETDRRTWGPYADRDHPGHQVRFIMERQGGQFDYRLQYRPTVAGEEAWWSLMEGTFQASSGVRKGEGEVHLFIEDAKAHDFDVGGLRAFRQLDIGYQTRELPTKVEMLFTSASVLLPDTRYGYRELPGGFGEMRFVVQGTDAVPGGQREDVEITTRWTPGQGGVSSFVILKGDLQGASYTECWDAQGRITWMKRNWEWAGSGDPTACPDVSAFGL
jgi:hypothetical protein